MEEVLALFLALVALSGLTAATHYDNSHTECWEQTMCHEPAEYPNVDFIEEIDIRDEGLDTSWNGTIEIRDVSFHHDFSGRVENGSFETIDEDSGRDKAGDTKVTFDGVMQVGSMCNEPIFDVEVVESSRYTIDVYGNDTYGVRSCSEQPVKVEYTLTLDTYTQEMEAVVNQNNVTESFQTDEYRGLPRSLDQQGVPEGEKQEGDEQEEDEVRRGGDPVQEETGGLLDGAIGIYSSYIGAFTGFF